MTDSIIKYFIEFLQSQNVNNLDSIVQELHSDKTTKELSDILSSKVEESVDKKKISKKSISEKKNIPKKPMSAYIYFCMEKRNEIKEQNPTMSTIEITRELGRLWKTDYLHQFDRKKWTSMSDEDKKRYKEQSVHEDDKKKKETKKELVPIPDFINKPPKPNDDSSESEEDSSDHGDEEIKRDFINPYMFYYEQMLESIKQENPNMNHGEITKLIRVNWLKLSDQEKMQIQEKARHEQEMKNKLCDEREELKRELLKDGFISFTLDGVVHRDINVDLKKNTVYVLKLLAKYIKIHNYSKLKKEQLIEECNKRLKL